MRRTIRRGGGGPDHGRLDWLGSERLAAWTNQTLASEEAYAPFGEAYAGAGAGEQMFTGKGQRLAAGIYDFPFRHYSPAQGRWLSPDPAGLAAVNPANPQSWNAYAYVGDTPLTATDPLGLGTITFKTVVSECITCVGVWQPSPWNLLSPTYWDFMDASMEPPTFQTPSKQTGGNASRGGAATAAAPPWWFISIRQPGQSFGKCMAANASTYSLGGAGQLIINVATNSNVTALTSTPAQILFGNSINSVLFGSPSDAGLAMASNAPGGLAASMGTITTYGRRTSEIVSLNLPGAGGLPTALGDAAAGTRSFFQTAGDWLSLGMSLTTRLSVDGALTGAEAIGCVAP